MVVAIKSKYRHGIISNLSDYILVPKTDWEYILDQNPDEEGKLKPSAVKLLSKRLSSATSKNSKSYNWDDIKSDFLKN
jgi:hypothetical protein